MDNKELLAKADSLVKIALKKGADAADAVLFEGSDISVSCRNGELEELSRSEGYDIGLRVFIGKKQAIISSSDKSEASFAQIAEKAISMAKVVPEDKYAGLAPNELLANDYPQIEMMDVNEPSVETLLSKVKETEEAALKQEGVTNSEGASASYAWHSIALSTSLGFSGAYTRSSSGLSVSVIAGKNDTGMERDSAYSASVFFDDLKTPYEIGEEAGKRAFARLNSRKVKTGVYPVVYEPRVAKGLLSNLLAAINGSSISKGTSFLKDQLGQKIFASEVNVFEDPHMKRGHASKPFDAEGVANSSNMIIEEGVLQHWILDCYSANKLGLQTNGHAVRGTTSSPVPGTTNVNFVNGKQSEADMIASIKSGFYVTDVFGNGVNLITGDYSRGASGFWIEDGKISFPVSEMTIAGNLTDIFASMILADNLEYKTAINSPSIFIPKMTVAGS